MGNILIIGAGEIGRALAKILEQKNPVLWSRNPRQGATTESLEKLVSDKDIIFLALPTSAHRPILKKIKRRLKKDAILLSPAKGLNEKGRLVPEIIESTVKNQFGLLLGPMIAEEIMQGKMAYATAATTSQRVENEVKNLFQNTTLKITETTKDVKTSSLLGVVKNIYSILLGAVEAGGFGSNTQGFLFNKVAKEARAVVELLARLPARQGGEGELTETSVGLADLFTTATSIYSTNRQTGVVLIKERRFDQKGEGAVSIGAFKKRLGENFKKFPLLQGIYKTTKNPQNAKDIIEELVEKL